ncbi:MAG: HlyD family type I secretion periplasmic adaptor subunit [Lentisphaerae bacterium]|nr:HlyD family type I secretion periplasmic adaptor subunit [Lentisphaerota bacterium]
MSDKNNEKIPAKVVDFLPDALEIKHEKLPARIKFGVWIPFIVLAGAIVWACLAKTDVVVRGNGKLVTDLPTIVMKPLERSVIQKINVKIGDIVKKDDILITFDPAINTAEAERLKNEISAYEAHLARLQSEFQNKKYSGGKEQFAQWQLAIYRQRQEYYQERIRYFDETVLQIDATKKTKSDSLAKQKERLAAVQSLEDMFKGLYDKKVASLKELIQLSIDRMEMEATVDQIANDLLELDHRRQSILAEKNSFIQEWRNKISEDMVAVDRDLTSTRKEYDKIAQLIEYVYLRAPCNAVVHEVTSFSPGSAVREAEALITLIPLDGNIELEAQIPPENIGKVKVGAPVRVKLTAYPFQKYGTLDGVVRNISEDTLEKQEAGNSIKYYRARITVSGKLTGVKEDFRLIPGMEVQSDIKCDRRRVIEYILYPLIKALDETAKEP